ncbi:uncharacterized protein LOC144108690 [Amblyomma americanum]
MALTHHNEHLTALTNSQLEQLNDARFRFGQHVFYQETGESTTKSFTYGLAHQIQEAGVGIDIAIKVGKAFYLKFKNDEDKLFYEYRFPKSPGSTEAFSSRKYNEADKALDLKTTKNVPLPGFHILSIYLDASYQIMFNVDNKGMFDRAQDNIIGLINVFIESDSGVVFEVHQTSEDNDVIFDVTHPVNLSPTLTLGAYIEMTGTTDSDKRPKVEITQFPILARNIPKPKGYDTQAKLFVEIKVPQPSGPDQKFTCYIKYYKSHITVDAGAGIDVIAHKFHEPKRYHVTGATLHNMTVVSVWRLTFAIGSI